MNSITITIKRKAVLNKLDRNNLSIINIKTIENLKR